MSPPFFSDLMRSLGEAGEIEPETSSFLAEYEIDDSEFSQEVLDSLPVTSDGEVWTIPQVNPFVFLYSLFVLG